MTRDKSLFTKLSSKDGGFVTFGDNKKGKIIRISSISISPNPSIENVLLVNGLKYNLLSISQLCDNGNRVIFDKLHCSIESINDHKALFVINRHDNVYILYLNDLYASDVNCLYVNNENGWLWHRRLGHAHMDLIVKFLRKDLVIGLP